MLIKIILLLRMDRFIRYHQKIFRKKNIFRWLCAIVLFLIMAAMKIKDMWRKRRADIDCEERKEQEY